MKNFEEKLPEGYREAKVIDAKKDKRMVAFLMLLSLVWLFIALLLVDLIRGSSIGSRYTDVLENASPAQYFGGLSVFLLLLIVYMVLHELTHGAVYKAMTGHRLTFGFTLTVAYCGVPDIYTYRRTALLSLAAPLTVFSVVFVCGMVFAPNAIIFYYSELLFAMHLSGCAGDLYDIGLFLFKYRDPKTLMRDNGPTQWIYVPR